MKTGRSERPSPFLERIYLPDGRGWDRLQGGALRTEAALPNSMHPKTLLERLASRKGLPFAAVARYEALVERALCAAPGVRERLLQLVERSLEREAERYHKRLVQAQAAEDEALVSISRVLHAWVPPNHMDAAFIARFDF